MATPVETPLLRRSEAAEYLTTRGVKRTTATLAKLACIGGGPRFRVARRVPYYSIPDLDEWLESLFSPLVSSTSQLSVWRHRQARRTDQ